MKTILKLAGFLTLMVGVIGFASCKPTDTDSKETKPAAPTGLTVSKHTTTSVELSWNAVEGASSYTVVYNTVGGEEKKLPNIKQLKRSVTGLTAGTEYEWYVYAVNGLGDGPAAYGENFTTVQITVPDPANLVISDLRSNGATLNWDEAELVDGFAVKVNGDFDPSIASELEADGSLFMEWPISEAGPSFSLLSCLLPQKTYTWQAANKIGNRYSNWVDGSNVVTTAKVEWNFEALLGDYSGAATPTGLINGGKSSASWTGKVQGQKYSDGTYYPYMYGISNMFNANTSMSVTYMMAVVEIFDGKLYLSKYPVASGTTTAGEEIEVYFDVVAMDPSTGKILGVMKHIEKTIELVWDDTSKTLTFPATMTSSGETVALGYGIGPYVNGEHDGFYTDIHTDVKLTLAGGGARISYGKVIPAKKFFPTPAISFNDLNTNFTTKLAAKPGDMIRVK